MDFKTLNFLVKDRFAYVELNRPERRNAFHPQMIAELTSVFTGSSLQDPTCLGVVLSGAGPSFCSGADLEWMQSMVDYTLDENLLDSRKLFSMFMAMRNCPLPILAHVQGHVMGGGLGFLAVADFVAAESNTKFCFSEVRIGLAPAVISGFVVEKMPAAMAHRYMLTGDIFSSDVAKQAGLVHHTGDAEGVRKFVAEIKVSLRESGPEAVRASKKLLRSHSPIKDWAKTETECCQIISERRVSAEGQEGLRGFIDKREPLWKKKA